MKKIIALGLCFAVSTTAFAAEDFYAGAGIGSAKTKIDDTGFNESDLSFKLFGGFNISDNLAIEAAYYDFGKPSAQGMEVNTDGFGGFAVGIVPLNPQISLFAKAGFLAWDSDIHNTQAGLSASDSGTDFAFGFGGDVRVVDNIRVKAEYEHFNLDSDAASGLASVSLQINF